MNLSRTPRLKMIAADLALLLVAVIWGGGFIASKEALSSLSAFGVMSSRFLLSAAVMFLLFHKKILCGTGREIRYGVIIGAIQFIAFIFQLNGLALTTVERHSFLVTSYAIFVPFLSVALAHNPLRRRDVGCALLAVTGLALLCLKPGNLTPTLGDVLSLMAAICFSIQIVYVGNFVKGADMFSMTFFQLLTPGLLALPFSGLPDALVYAGENALTGIAYLVLLNTVFAFSAQNIAQQHTSDAHASLIISMEAVFGFLLAVWFYNHGVSLQECLGSVLMVAAIVLSNTKK